MATTESYLDADRRRQERTEWHSVTIWGLRASGLAKHLVKGSRIFVEGSLRTSSYEDKDGVTRYRTEVIARDVVFAGGRRQEAPPRQPNDDAGDYHGADDFPGF